MNQDETGEAGYFDVAAIAATLPETATTMLADRYLTNREAASSRVFRVYRPTPAHYHATCDEYLYVLSGRGSFWMGDPSAEREIGPGQLVVFPRGMVHSIVKVAEHPFVFFSIDTPRREPRDIIFVDPSEGSPETFMQRNAP